MRLHELNEGLDANQKRVGQVAGEESAKDIGPVLGKEPKQHPFKGRLVGEDLSENYPKHQDLSGISTEKLKAYLANQSQHSVPGEGSQVKSVQAELQRR